MKLTQAMMRVAVNSYKVKSKLLKQLEEKAKAQAKISTPEIV